MSDLGADPWGVMLLGTAGASAVTLLLVVACKISARSTTASGWALLCALLGFLGSAGAGAYSGTQHPSRATPEIASTQVTLKPSAAPKVVAAARGPELEDGEVEPKDAEPKNAEPKNAEPKNADVKPEVAALPEDPAALRTAVRLLLREGKRVATTASVCRDPVRVGAAWAAIAAIPNNVYRNKTRVVAMRLETCRRQITWSQTYATHRDRVKARDAFPKRLKRRLTSEDARIFASVGGKASERLRIGGAHLTGDEPNPVLTAALRSELEALGFSIVTLANGRRTWPMRLTAKPDNKVVAAQLAPYSLDKPLKLAR